MTTRRLYWSRLSFLVLTPAVIFGLSIGTLLGRFGVWIGSADRVGRALLFLTAVSACAGVLWRHARIVLTALVTFAFGGRAFGFLIAAPPGFDPVHAFGSAMSWAAITVAVLMLVHFWDLEITAGER